MQVEKHKLLFRLQSILSNFILPSKYEKVESLTLEPFSVSTKLHRELNTTIYAMLLDIFWRREHSGTQRHAVQALP